MVLEHILFSLQRGHHHRCFCRFPPSLHQPVSRLLGFSQGWIALSSLATSSSSLGRRAFCFCHSLVVRLVSPGCPRAARDHPPAPPTHSPVRRLWIMDKSGWLLMKYKFSKGDYWNTQTPLTPITLLDESHRAMWPTLKQKLYTWTSMSNIWEQCKWHRPTVL